jgi:hypothetical protein
MDKQNSKQTGLAIIQYSADKSMPGIDVTKAAAPGIVALTKSPLCILFFSISMNIA